MKNIFLRLLIVIVGVAAGFAVLIFAIYSMAWFAFVKQAQRMIDYAWSNMTETGYTISGEKPEFRGYPFPPHLEFSGKITNQYGLSIDIPEMEYVGFPASTQVQFFDFPKGFKLVAPFLSRPLVIDGLSAQIRIPAQLPLSARPDDLREWPKQENPFRIERLVARSGMIIVDGDGTIGLSETLQLDGMLNTRVQGMNLLFDQMAMEGNFPKKDMDAAKGFLEMLSKNDPDTGQKYFETTLRIQDRGAFFGPLRIATIPELKWGEAPTSPKREKPPLETGFDSDPAHK